MEKMIFKDGHEEVISDYYILPSLYMEVVFLTVTGFYKYSDRPEEFDDLYVHSRICPIAIERKVTYPFSKWNGSDWISIDTIKQVIIEQDM